MVIPSQNCIQGDSQIYYNILGVANGTSKNVGLGKFWQDLEISEAFLVSLEVSLPKSLGLGFLTRISASRQVSDFTIRHPLYSLRGSLRSADVFPVIRADVFPVIRLRFADY